MATLCISFDMVSMSICWDENKIIYENQQNVPLTFESIGERLAPHHVPSSNEQTTTKNYN